MLDPYDGSPYGALRTRSEAPIQDMDEGRPLQRAPLGDGPDDSVAQKRRYRRVDESISHAGKRPAPVVLCADLGVEWLFDLGAELAVWAWPERPDVTRLQRTRTPKVNPDRSRVIGASGA
jgi:hypothetical protein